MGTRPRRDSFLVDDTGVRLLLPADVVAGVDGLPVLSEDEASERTEDCFWRGVLIGPPFGVDPPEPGWESSCCCGVTRPACGAGDARPELVLLPDLARKACAT
jgi:hypothetical protein